MPHFYFDVREEDRITPDEVGVELKTVEPTSGQASKYALSNQVRPRLASSALGIVSCS
jgi:hypothetical protein